jgi:hypothetical protein
LLFRTTVAGRFGRLREIAPVVDDAALQFLALALQHWLAGARKVVGRERAFIQVIAQQVIQR